MNKLSLAIEECINECKESGNGYIELKENTIKAEWEEWELDFKHDVITVYIYQNNVVKFRYQLEETKMEAN